MLYQLVDKIMEKWRQVEHDLQGAELKIDGLDLSIERRGQHMRLCFRGKPLNECRATEKIEAVDCLDKLYQEVERRDSQMIQKAEQALSKLEEWLKEKHAQVHDF